MQTSIRELCQTILVLRQSDLNVTYKPYFDEDARRMVRNRIGCPVKAKKELGFEYEIDLKSGLRDLIKWRKSNS